MKKLLCAAYAVFALSGSIFGAEKVTVAVLDLNPKGVPQIVAAAVSDIVRSEFVNIANFTVVERSQMKAILDEQGLQMSGCTDSSCAVQLGKILSAKRIVVGEVTKMGQGALIAIRYVDVTKGSSMFAAKETAKTMDDIQPAAEKAAKGLAQRIVQEDKDILTQKSPTQYYVSGIVPGLGQFYADRPIKGSIFASVFVLSAGFVFYTWSDYTKKEKDYGDLERGSMEFDSKYDDYEKAGKLFDYSLILLGVVYTANWVDIIFLSKPDFGAGDDKETAANYNYFNIDSRSFSQHGGNDGRIYNLSYNVRF